MADYSTILSLLESMQDEIKALALKKPDMLLSILKVKMVNKLINGAREILVNELTLEFLPQELEEENLPQYSDVVIIIGQFLTALRQFKKDNNIGEIDISKMSEEDLILLEQIYSKYQ